MDKDGRAFKDTNATEMVKNFVPDGTFAENRKAASNPSHVDAGCGNKGTVDKIGFVESGNFGATGVDDPTKSADLRERVSTLRTGAEEVAESTLFRRVPVATMNFASNKGRTRGGGTERASLNTGEGQDELDGGKKATTALMARVTRHVGSRRWAGGCRQRDSISQLMNQVGAHQTTGSTRTIYIDVDTVAKMLPARVRGRTTIEGVGGKAETLP